MKNKNLFFKIYIAFVVIFAVSIIVLSFLGNKERIGYLSEFKINITETLELNNLNIEEINQLFTVNNNLDEAAITNYVLTNNSIMNYSYNFRIKYYDKVFRNSDIYGVYLDTNKVIEDNNFIKNISIGGGSPFGNLTSNKIIDFENIDNINYILKLKIIYSITDILIFLFFIFFYKSIFNKKLNFSISNKLFIIVSISIGVILFLFHFWLVYPGYFNDTDVFLPMVEGFLGIGNNAQPRIIGYVLSILYNTFGYYSFYILFINLFLWYFAITLIVISLYYKFYDIRILLLFFISFLNNIFFPNIFHIRDVTATLFFIASCSIILSLICIDYKYMIIKISLYAIFLVLVTISMLWRHNFIVTVYPIFIIITYKILNIFNFTNKIKYILSFFSIMFIFAIYLVLVFNFFPIIVKSDQKSNFSTTHLFLMQISACAVVNNDDSMILEEWYENTKTFDDLKKAYNKNKFNADILSAPWVKDRIFKSYGLTSLEKSWIKYIIKYPIDYIKFILEFSLKIYNAPITYDFRLSSNDLQNISEWRNGYELNDLIKPSKANFSNIKKLIYDFLYNFLPYIPFIIIFILLSNLLFIINLILITKKSFRSDQLFLLSFSIFFSSFSTAFITAIFLPVIDYRYIYPVIPITIIGIIIFVAFICNRGGIKKVILEFRG